MYRIAVVFLITFGLLAGFAWARDDDDDASPKGALQALNEFIGEWKGNGAPEKRRVERGESWDETLSWSWRFKKDDAWLILTVKNGRYFKSGELRYLPDSKRYQLTAVDKDDKKLIFTGASKDGYLTLERLDPDSKETQRLTMNSASDGLRFIYRYAHKPEGRTLFTKDYLVACTRAGESLAGKENKVECPVSGGLGTIPVSYNGKTYYVCCSGCRDAFNENPEKYVKEFEAKKKKK
jgi:YHS domain